MIKVIGKKANKTKIKRQALKVAQSLGINEEVTIYFMEHTSPDKLGFAATIMGSQYICIFADCPDEKLAEVIGHEMIHVYQTLRGDLIHDYTNSTFYWKGERYDDARLSSIDYHSRPWEAEAKQKEKQLAEVYGA